MEGSCCLIREWGSKAEKLLMLMVGSILTPRVIDIFFPPLSLHRGKPLPGFTFASAGRGWLC